MRTGPRLTIHGWDIPTWKQSRAYIEMCWQARGLYRELCDHCYLDGAVPDDPRKCAVIAGCPPKTMVRYWQQIRLFFLRHRHREGWLRHAEVDRVRLAAHNRYMILQKRAQKGGIATSIKNNKLDDVSGALGALQARHARPNPTPPLPEVEVSTKNQNPLVQQSSVQASIAAARNGFDFEAWFALLYAAHPRPGKKQIAQQYASEHVPARVSPEEASRVHALYCQCDQWRRGYAPNLSEFFSSELYLHEPPTHHEETELERMNRLKL